ncbi:MAG TPA: hypothetical protein VFS23_20165 [Vicinamibacterales bacterium]|nr:hypothetical protein [Vicinamibacterales bacterium]
MAAYQDVHDTWGRLSRDGHVGMTDAFQIVLSAANDDEGRRALAELLARDENVAMIDPDALSYLRVSRDVPLPPGVENHRADAYFRTRFYTGTRLSKTHRVENPREFLYFNYAIGMLVGTLDEVTAVKAQIRGSGYEPVLVRMPDGREKAIGTVMINEFRDTTFGPYDEIVFYVSAVPVDSPATVKRYEYVNGFSLQVPLDRGATTYQLKLWLSELSPTDGGNDFLGTNKELGSFRFEDLSDGTMAFRSWDKELKALVSGKVPRALTTDAAAAKAAYRAAADRAGTTVPVNSVATIPVASRPDEDVGRPAHQWAIAVDWRECVVQEITPRQVSVVFGESEWGRRFHDFVFTPALSFYTPSGVGEIVQHIGDCPYAPAVQTTREFTQI